MAMVEVVEAVKYLVSLKIMCGFPMIHFEASHDSRVECTHHTAHTL